MNIVISGASGLIGRALLQVLETQGHRVWRLVRRKVRNDEAEIAWDPERGELPIERLEGCDAIIHLAGESISGRWTVEKKRRILASRVDGTQLLARRIAELNRPPAIMLSASAVGYYGDRGHEWQSETSPSGSGFLAQVCQQWEAAARPVEARGVRLALLRFGVVLDTDGGALAAMLPIFRLGLGGPLGDGQQYFSWITRDDATAAVLRVLGDDSLSGPVNVCAPAPVTNAELTSILGRAVGRPTWFRVPRFMLRLVTGDMAEEMLLSSTRAAPLRLQSAGFTFGDPELEPALRRLVSR